MDVNSAGGIPNVRLTYAGFKPHKGNTCNTQDHSSLLISCDGCHIILKVQANTTGDPIEWHVEISPRCPYLRRLAEHRLQSPPTSQESEYSIISLQDVNTIHSTINLK